MIVMSYISFRLCMLFHRSMQGAGALSGRQGWVHFSFDKASTDL